MNLKYIPAFMLAFISCIGYASGQLPDTTVSFHFIKKELLSGVFVSGSPERDELLTDDLHEKEELYTGSILYTLGTRYWNYIGQKQEQLSFKAMAGPIAGTGDWLYNTDTEYIAADHTIYGLRARAAIDYENRLYYDYNNHTVVGINAWGRYDVFRKNSEGIHLDSNDVVTDFEEQVYDDNLRYGFRANAAWGYGRLNPVNHFMTAEYLLQKYYPRRVFSEEEIILVSREIGRIKHRRIIRETRKPELEIVQLNDFLKNNILLAAPENIQSDWVLGEFLPRFDGWRWELGPWFNYYNREPDFVYGGYAEFRRDNYVSFKRNRNLKTKLSYNRYKTSDWLLLENSFEWAFYRNLDTRYSFGISYIPGMVVNDFTNLEPVSHNFMPFASYYRQINRDLRIDLALAWKIADGERYMQSGPEFKLTFYNSRY